MEKLGKICRNNVCIISDIDRQYTLSKGTVEEVEEYVRKVIHTFGQKEGGNHYQRIL